MIGTPEEIADFLRDADQQDAAEQDTPDDQDHR